MKTRKNIIATYLLVFVIFNCSSQMVITPYSFNHSLTNSIPAITVSSHDFKQDIAFAEESEKNGSYPIVAKHFNINATTAQEGIWTTLDNGDRIWQLRIKSKGAISTCVFFDNFFIPEGAILSEYSPDHSQVFNYTYDDNQGNLLFSGEFIKGEEQIIEYYEPLSVKGKGAMHITDLAHQFRELTAGACQVNVICTPEGTGWQDKKRGICRLYVVSNVGYAGYCSGTLINNTALDCKRYILTAYHCGGQATQAQFDQWKFYFNFEATQCTGQADTYGVTSNYFTGCTKRAGSDINGGSDFLLIEMTPTTSPSWWASTAFFNGWTKSTSAFAGFTSIHHPSGSNKKISSGTAIPYTTTYSGCAPNAHWRVNYVASTNGHSVPEQGSSGSPLFNGNGHVMGTLTGGSASCSTLTNPEIYGKVSYHWASSGTTSATQLKTWLDPINSGVTTLSGGYSPCNSIGINEYGSINNFSIYPNPSNGLYTLSYELNKENTITVSVVNVLGQEIFNDKIYNSMEGNYTIDLSIQQTGIYFVEFRTNEQVISKKISIVK